MIETQPSSYSQHAIGDPTAQDARIALWHHLFDGVTGTNKLSIFSAKRPPPPDRELVSPQEAFFTWPDRATGAALEVATQAAAGREVYHCAHLLTRSARCKAAAADVHALWRDDDGANNLPGVQPTAEVESSDGRRQSYLRVDRPIPIARAESLNRRWAQATGGDKSGWDATQLLRSPGGLNFKYDPPFPVRLLHLDTTRAYDPDELDELLPAYRGSQQTPGDVAAVSLPDDVSDGDNPPVSLNHFAYQRWIGEHLRRKDDGSVDRSNSLWWIGVDLAQARATREQIAQSVANRDARLGWNKYTERPDCETRYTEIADGALDYVNAPTFETPETDEATEPSSTLDPPPPDTTTAPFAKPCDDVGASAPTPEHRNGHAKIPLDLELDTCPPLPAAAQLDPALAAEASPWLDAYIAHSRRWSPRAADVFHEAVGLWQLSTIAARRVQLHLGDRRYSSLYVLLAGRSSLYAKTTTAKIGLQTLQAAGLDWLLAADDATPQKFIHDLTGRLPSGYADWDGHIQERVRNRLARPGQRGWFYEEFGQHLAAMTREGGYMADFRGILRRFDDHPERHEYGTISRGDDVVLEPYLALLGNVTPADLRPLAKRGATMWNDGFWARFAFVVPETEERKRERFPDGEREVPASLTRPLQAWHARLGLPSITIEEEAQRDGTVKRSVRRGPWQARSIILGAGVFDAFYTYHDALLDIVAGTAHEDLDGNYCRFAEKALRVAILLASLENEDHLELRHWARGQEIAERWRAGLHRLVSRLNEPEPSAEQQMEERCLRAVEALGKATAREVGQRIRGLGSAEAYTCLEGLAKAGDLQADRTGRTTRYSLPQGATR